MEMAGPGLSAVTGSGPIPASHADLLTVALPAVLTTEMPDGRLQSTVVWYGLDGADVLINTMWEFQKARNLRTRPRATVLVVEPGDTGRWIEVRARALPDDRDALSHLDEMSLRYVGVAPYFGRVVPAPLAAVEHPVVYRLVAQSVCTGPQYFHGPRPARSVAPVTVPSPGPTSEDEPVIPASHRDLLTRPLLVALSTRMPDGAAQTHPVWCSLDGNHVLVNTTLQRRKGRNLAADPRATVLALDPYDSGRWIELRGDVTLDDRGALDHLDELTRQYTGKPCFYGHVYPPEQRRYEDRIIARIHPRRIGCDAIHR
jgi:PPOX class probable F420-dependent enzyme